MLTIAMNTVYSALLDAFGSANTISKPVTSRPPTTRFARPHRSANPAAREANAPARPAITATHVI